MNKNIKFFTTNLLMLVLVFTLSLSASFAATDDVLNVELGPRDLSQEPEMSHTPER